MIFWNPRRGVVGWPSQSSSVDVRESANKSWEFMISTGRLVRDREEQFVHSYPVISKTWCGKMLIRIENKFSMSLSPSASDSPGTTKSESQKVPLSLWNEQQPWTGRLVMDACSSKSSEWNNDDKWSSQVRRTGVHPIVNVRVDLKDVHRQYIFCTVSPVFVAGFVYSR